MDGKGRTELPISAGKAMKWNSLREGWASPGRLTGSVRRIFKAKPARGAGRDFRLTAAGRAGSQEQVRAAREGKVPRRAANGRTVADRAGLACQDVTEEQVANRTEA
ncbi:hypothetical protein GCM10007925_11000 [Sphingomonas astaxanthinifaciens DSM 22298]|uniref:Uncharacterized protein n=1 Tax=Sphingomonas astaxanthinifaciens DSM 22298 TaxID=1123267 RepID=A0ABQ5Z5X0_9SPHN|nr:hypothetical protein GCM10007925_11000 [Sphingomonas astaxanthinifaciens DSM 22298]